MEAPSPLLFALCFLVGKNHSLVPLIFLGLWEAHYIHRAFIYPFSLRGNRMMPVSVIAMAIVFNLMNAFFKRQIYLYAFNPIHNTLADRPRFIGGLTLFVIGYLINRSADRILHNLRAPGKQVTRFPKEGFTAGFPVRITSGRLWSGAVGHWRRGHCPAWHLPSGQLRTWHRAPVQITDGTGRLSRIIRLNEKHWCRCCGRGKLIILSFGLRFPRGKLVRSRIVG